MSTLPTAAAPDAVIDPEAKSPVSGRLRTISGQFHAPYPNGCGRVHVAFHTSSVARLMSAYCTGMPETRRAARLRSIA